jgi:hypothetical protein
MDMVQRIAALNIYAGWLGFLAGIISGAVIGMFFHREDWMGGYNSYRRRMVRLGHISFFGLGILNVLFGLTLNSAHFPVQWLPWASWCMLAGAFTMPLCCFLSAWRNPFRHLFFVPVSSLLSGVAIILFNWGYL